MLTVVASYRQNVHAYPSGGGDYEVATVNLGSNAGVTVAAALLVDYVLTVAVSVSSGVQNAGVRDPLRGRATRRRSPCVLVVVLAALNLRGVRESGAFFALPTYGFMVGVIGMALLRRDPRRRTARCPQVESARPTIIPAPGYGGDISQVGAGLPAGARVLLRLCRADRRRGDLQRRAGLPQAEEQERRDHAAPARHHRDHDAAEHHRAGQPDGPEVRRPERLDRLPGADGSPCRRASTSTR